MVHLTSIICVKSKGKVRLDHRTNVDAGAHVPCHNRLGIVNHPSTGRGDRESRIPCGLSGTPPSETCTSRQLTTPHGTLFTVHRLFYCDLVTEIGRHDTRKVTGTRSDDRYNVELPTRRRKMKEGGREEEPTDAPEAAAPGMRIEHTCCCLGVLVGISLIAALVAVILMKDTTVEVTVLRQVHVLMSHGERTPSERELAMLGAPPPDHVFSPYGAGAMTNEGKMLTYEMGALLRKRYNEFLGSYYDEENSIVIASDTELSKMTALLISAGLWPPPEEQMWNETILWQPVSYTYPPRNQDYLLYEENCPRYLQEKQRILDAFTEEGLLSPYKDFFHKIAQMTNTNFSTPQEAYDLNNLFLIQDDIKVANPKWAKHVKRKLMDIARLEYSMMFHNNLLRKLSGGALLQQIIKEATSNIVEGPNLRVIVRTGTPENVAALLAACVAPPPRLPDPGAALLFELHERLPQPHQKNKKAVLEKARFGLKIYYWDDDSAEPRLMEVPGCDSPFCPIDTFKELTKYTISHNYKEDCKIAPVT